MIGDNWENYETIRIDQIPETKRWKFEPLYDEDVKGKVRIWEIGFDGDDLIILHGTLDGIKQIVRTEVPENARGKTILDQALLHARSRYRDRKRKDGFHERNEKKVQDVEAMSAKTWVPKELYLEAKMKKDPSILGKNRWDPNWAIVERYPVAVQPKLDGIRLICKKSFQAINSEIDCRSRNNIRYNHLEHINQEIDLFFDYLPEGTQLDGELYIHGRSFNEVSGMIRSTKNLNPNLEEVKYYIFDLITPESIPFEDRYTLMINAYKRYLDDGNLNTHFFLITATFAYDENDILNFHHQYVDLGYEGTMVRKLAAGSSSPKNIEESIYQSKRSGNLLKIKDWYDEEGEIIDVYEGKGTEKGAANFTVRMKNGNTFGLRAGGSIDQRKKWFDSPNSVIGKDVKYAYQELSENGIPRFPRFLGIRFPE